MKRLIKVATRELDLIMKESVSASRRTHNAMSLEATAYAEAMLYHIELDDLDAEELKAGVQMAFDLRDKCAALEKVANAPIDAEVMVGITYSMREGGCRHFERRVPLTALQEEIGYVKREAERQDFIEGTVLSGAGELYGARLSDWDAEWKAYGDRAKLIEQGRREGRFNLILTAEGM